MSITLSYEELQKLTGLKQRKRMADWLRERGWVFEPPRRRGETPAVDRAYYLARMSGQAPGATRSRLKLDRM
jgi:hypothetical protein